jgi:hypothetical protein
MADTCAHPLFGGVTLEEARRIHQESVTQPWARKTCSMSPSNPR